MWRLLYRAFDSNGFARHAKRKAGRRALREPDGRESLQDLRPARATGILQWMAAHAENLRHQFRRGDAEYRDSRRDDGTVTPRDDTRFQDEVQVTLMDITKATIEDAQQILALQRLAYRSEAAIYSDLSLPPLTETLAQLQVEFDRSLFLKVVADGRIVGSVRGRSDGRTCFVGRLIVHPDHQKQGLGTRLMHEIERRFPDVGRFELFTGCRSESNLRLYERLGYRRFKEEQPMQSPPLVFLEKDRKPGPPAAATTDDRLPTLR